MNSTLNVFPKETYSGVLLGLAHGFVMSGSAITAEFTGTGVGQPLPSSSPLSWLGLV